LGGYSDADQQNDLGVGRGLVDDRRFGVGVSLARMGFVRFVWRVLFGRLLFGRVLFGFLLFGLVHLGLWLGCLSG
jgi:hypothetical protein